MELKSGYKQTEVGVIPEEWEIDTIVNLASITTGDKNTQDRVEDGTYPFFVRSSTVERINSCTFDGEAVLTAGDGVGTGKIFHYINGKFDFHQRVYKISDFDARLDGYFFYLYFSNNFYSRIMQMTAKSSVDSVRREMIADMRIPVPLPEEQRALAAALSDVADLLTKLDQLITKKRYIKQAAMQQLLTGKRRLPGFSGKWEVKRLGEVADVDPENLGSDTLPDYSFKYISLEDVDTGTLQGYTEQIFRSAPSRARRKLTKGDILVSTVRPNLKSHLLMRDDVSDTVCSTGFSVLRCKPALADPAFVYSHLFAGGIERQIESLLTGSSYPAINSGDVKALRIPYPPPTEQTAIASVLSDMDAEIAALEARRDKTRDLKQGMMQELLTGRIRLLQSVHGVADRKQQKEAANTGHNWAINEAVVISALAAKFGSRKFPLGRMRYTKLSYLMHRHVEKQAERYLKKAAGPYNPETRYKGPETIAQKNRYIEAAQSGKLSGFIAARNIDQALDYFNKWYGREVLEWLEQFRYEKNENLELLTTVDMACQDLRANGRKITVEAVKEVLRVHPEWQPKLKREIFSDAHIKQAIIRCRELFG